MFVEIVKNIVEKNKLAIEAHEAEIAKTQAEVNQKTEDFYNEIKDKLAEEIKAIIEEEVKNPFHGKEVSFSIIGVDFDVSENLPVRRGKYIRILTKLSSAELCFEKIAKHVQSLFTAEGLKSAMDDTLFMVNSASYRVKLPSATA